MFINDYLGEWQRRWEAENPEPKDKPIIPHADWLGRRFRAYENYLSTMKMEG